MPRSPIARLVHAQVILSVLVAGPANAAQSISVDAHRPLAALADELEARYQIVVTYEDAPCPALRKVAFTFNYPKPSGNSSVPVADVLAAFLTQYHDAGLPGKYRVEGERGRYHLIPAEVEDASGRWTPALPVLDTPIDLPEQERTVDDTLDEVVAQINTSAQVKVGWGFTPLNLFHQTRIRLGAERLPAREVMRRILERFPQRITWRLNYDPTTKRYYLSFLTPASENRGIPDVNQGL